MIGALNYELKDLSLLDLAKEVPEDATIVIVADPMIPLQSAEWSALERYLDRGGRLMVMLDPEGETAMGSLEGRARREDGRRPPAR